MQGTLYTGGIGNISGTDCAHIPLWITYMDGRCQQLLWGVMTGFRHWQVPWEFRELPVVTQCRCQGPSQGGAWGDEEDPRDRAPFVGLDLCISKGIGYVQGTYLCRVRPLRRRLRSNPYKGSDLYTGRRMT